MSKLLLSILTLFILITIGFTAYQFSQRANNKSNINTPSISTPTPTVKAEPSKPEISIEESIRSALFKKDNWEKTDDIVVKISTNDGKYASGTVNSTGSGGYFYAIKDNGNWVIVADGNGIISCSSLVDYPDYPKNLISSCYDQVADKIVKR